MRLEICQDSFHVTAYHEEIEKLKQDMSGVMKFEPSVRGGLAWPRHEPSSRSMRRDVDPGQPEVRRSNPRGAGQARGFRSGIAEARLRVLHGVPAQHRIRAFHEELPRGRQLGREAALARAGYAY
eukprot:608984-Heterocapsa_arctica.AAC.1